MNLKQSIRKKLMEQTDSMGTVKYKYHLSTLYGPYVEGTAGVAYVPSGYIDGFDIQSYWDTTEMFYNEWLGAPQVGQFMNVPLTQGPNSFCLQYIGYTEVSEYINISGFEQLPFSNEGITGPYATAEDCEAQTNVIEVPVECPEGTTWDEASQQCVSDIEVIPGCTDPEANNYNEEANEDDGSCDFGITDDPEDPSGDDDEEEVISGCTDPEAFNYDSTATVDDGSCIYLGEPDDPCTGNPHNICEPNCPQFDCQDCNDTFGQTLDCSELEPDGPKPKSKPADSSKMKRKMKGKLRKNEQTTAGASGSYVAPISMSPIKRKIKESVKIKESTLISLIERAVYSATNGTIIKEALTTADEKRIGVLARKELKDYEKKLEKKIDQLIKKSFKGKDFEDKTLKITRNAIIQLYKALWIRRSFWTDYIKNVPS